MKGVGWLKNLKKQFGFLITLGNVISHTNFHSAKFQTQNLTG